MNTHYNIYSKLAAALMAVALPSLAQAQVPGSALDYMLQRPRVTKVYKQKRPFDHLFVDLGAGLNVMGTKEYKLGPTAEFGFGDWITPEHGLRLNVDAGLWRIKGKKVKYADLSLDYLINITAIASPGTYYTPRPFELIAIGGVSHAWSRNHGEKQDGWGVHLGLRGQLVLADYAYLYLEPRAGLMEDQVSMCPTWHGYRPYGSVTAGVGYRLPEQRLRRTSQRIRRPFADGLFFSVMGGYSMLLNEHPSTWDGRTGGRVAGSIGKWFDDYSALRLTANATSIDQYNSKNHIKALGLQLDYMANLNNVFGGPKERPFWANFVAGVSYNRSSDDLRQPKYSFGVGAGLQANIRLARGLALSFEPRVDYYADDYAPRTSSFLKHDIPVSFLAGLTYTYHDRRAAGVTDVDDIRHSSLTVTGGFANYLNNMDKGDTYMPIGRISYAQWHAPALGWRVGLQGMAHGKKATGYNYAQASVVADWMTDLTALSCGYDRSRALSFRTVAGFSLGLDYAKSGGKTNYFSPDFHVGGQMAVRLTDDVRIVAEPQLSYQFSERLSPARVGRFMPSFSVGLEYSMQRSKGKGEKVDKAERADFVSASVGTGLYTGNFGEMHPFRNRLSFLGEVGYGHWLNGVSGVHASIANTTVQRAGSSANQNITALSAGYMMNMKAAVTGEQSDADLFQLTGIADLSLVGSKKEGHDMKVTMGGKLALQAGFRISKAVELYVEPAAVIYGKGVEVNAVKHHPLEGEARLSIGTKYHF